MSDPDGQRPPSEDRQTPKTPKNDDLSGWLKEETSLALPRWVLVAGGAVVLLALVAIID